MQPNRCLMFQCFVNGRNITLSSVLVFANVTAQLNATLYFTRNHAHAMSLDHFDVKRDHRKRKLGSN